jgi:hypothetical protein
MGGAAPGSRHCAIPRHGSGLQHHCIASGMAPNANYRLNTICYPHGTITAAKGLLTYLFGSLAQPTNWLPPLVLDETITARRRRKYGTRQRGSARAGEAMRLLLNNGESYTVRITGTHTDFIDWFLAKGGGKKVANVYSERGTIYGPQIVDQTMTV